MRYITVVRHAKAERASEGQGDFERALNGRGRRQCAALREWASDQRRLDRYGPAIALVSSAVRTRETFERSFEGTDFVSDCTFSDSMYNGQRDVSADDLLTELRVVDPLTSSLLVVGHNPTVWEVVCTLLGELPASLRDGYPLAGAFVLAWPAEQPVAGAGAELVERFVPEEK